MLAPAGRRLDDETRAELRRSFVRMKQRRAAVAAFAYCEPVPELGEEVLSSEEEVEEDKKKRKKKKKRQVQELDLPEVDRKEEKEEVKIDPNKLTPRTMQVIQDMKKESALRIKGN